MNILHTCQYGEITSGYQYCLKCNKAVPAECRHHWEVIKNYEAEYVYTKGQVDVYILQCKNCGDIKKRQEP